MGAKRRDDVDRRNITLHPDTYDKFDRFLLELMQEKGNLKLSRNDAVEVLLEEHYERRKKS